MNPEIQSAIRAMSDVTYSHTITTDLRNRVEKAQADIIEYSVAVNQAKRILAEFDPSQSRAEDILRIVTDLLPK